MTQKLSENALENKKAYTKEYKKNNYKRVPLDLKMDKYEELKEHSQKVGETVNGYIKKSIEMRMDSEK